MLYGPTNHCATCFPLILTASAVLQTILPRSRTKFATKKNVGPHTLNAPKILCDSARLQSGGLSLLGYISACQCVVVEGWMSSRQVKAAAYKAAESRAGASGRGSRDASKKSANLACLPGPPLTINQPTKYTSLQYNQPTKSFIHSKKIKCYQFVVFLLVAANALNSSKKGNWRRTQIPGCQAG